MAEDFRSVLDMLRRAADRVDENVTLAARMSADIAAAEAKREHDYTDRSGVLTASIMADGPRGTFRDGSLSATVAAGAPYGQWIEHGSKKHPIAPKYRKMLRWPGPNGFIFARKVQHPGIRPRKFLAKASERALPRMTGEIIPQAIELSFLEAGFKRGK